MGDYRNELISTFRKEIESNSFIEFCRNGHSKSFTRTRVFTLPRLIVLIMLLKTSYQREINSFCKKLIKGDYNIRKATAGALTQARAKLNSKAFKRLNDLAVENYYKGANYKKWKGYRLIAVDGSVLNLPYSKSIIEEFGYESYIEKRSGKKSMARCSLLYDVKNQVTLDAQMSGYKTSEKALLKRHLDKIKPGDLVLADRGYASSAIIYWLFEQGAEFCIRFVDYKMNSIKEFLKSNLDETEIKINVNLKTHKEDQIDGGAAPIKVRVVKVILDSGEIELLVTSLFDNKKYDKATLKELYFLRWGVEEAFKMLKSRIDLESWSGKTARSVYQDFYAKTFMMTLCASLSHPIEQKVREEFQKEKTGNIYDQKINRTDAMSETKDNIFKIFLSKTNQKIIDVIDDIIIASRTVIRPNRKNKRLKIVKKRKPLNYKKI